MTKDEKAAYWRQQVDGFQASGLSVKNYCAQEGIAVATLHYWRKRFAEAVELQPMGTGTEGFLPVTLTTVRPSVPPVEIHLLSGRRLKLTAPMDAGWLQTLVRVLENPCG
ncbi:IS66 family insertion sequence element accessory protein TnpB [Acidithiobacillus ferrooxidans]|uniref:IS66 family insertion sequence element accessory protein TnpA n=1 Tax=Acidithiobacillus ferrooxidans TaxID=920 RepID=UPI00214C6248|nr:IS66 family insertion sequence element accessory protein TnpB [Acidithiobacillus ferrooxidans]MCR2831977.1 IS66 family insertion sequence element accessory protein TnpB [Acidithiobacillus ferrooxidans]